MRSRSDGNIRIRLILILALLTFFEPAAWGAAWTADDDTEWITLRPQEILVEGDVPKDEPSPVPEPSPSVAPLLGGLSFSRTAYEAERTPRKRKKDKISVKLQGVFDRSGWTLITPERRLVPSQLSNEKGEFTFPIEIKEKEGRLDLLAIGPKGQLERQTVILDFPNWGTSPIDLANQYLRRRHTFSSSLGYSYGTYFETRRADFAQMALNLKLTYDLHIIPGALALGVSVFGTALPFGQSTTVAATRFMGWNARLGWELPRPQGKLKVRMYLGGYYITMFVGGNAHGFTNMAGPQIYPSLHWVQSRRTYFTSYFKFSPVMSQLAFMTLSNREIAGGLAWNRMLSNGHPISIGIDVSNLSLEITGIKISSSNYGVSVGYGW